MQTHIIPVAILVVLSSTSLYAKDKLTFESLHNPCSNKVETETIKDAQVQESEVPKQKLKPAKAIKAEKPGNVSCCKMSGKMVFEVLINKEGIVTCVQLLKIDGESEKCAVRFAETIYKWRYNPAMTEEGVPVEAYTLVTINTSRTGP